MVECAVTAEDDILSERVSEFGCRNSCQDMSEFFAYMSVFFTVSETSPTMLQQKGLFLDESSGRGES